MARLNILNMMSKAPDKAKPAREDVTPQAQGSQMAQLAHQLGHNFEESGKGWFWAADDLGRITYLSPRFAEIFARPLQELAGASFIDLFAPSGAETAPRERLSFVLNRRTSFERITQQSANPGERRWWEISGRAQTDASGQFTGYLGFGIDVTEQLESSQSASQLALYDALTGLPNRLSMQNRLDEMESVMSVPGRACAVVLIDLDRFKAVNDSLGHPAGDALLKLVSERLIKIVGNQELVFRLGGDEFQLILPGHDDCDTLGEMAQKIIDSLSQPYSIEGSRCIIGASLGIARGPHDAKTGEELMRNADLALYAAKDAGRGCYRFFEPKLLQSAEDRRAIEEDLRDALGKGELSLMYQPVVSMKSSCATGVEALVRWHHPTRGPISPALFIPIAEEANLIEPMGEWIMRKACDEAAAWPADIRVAVNVSPIQFANPALPGIVMSALANSGLPPDRLELEITEGVFLENSEETDAMFAALKRIGVRLALDDFGTGYSSLCYLKTAPFDKIKIDQSFVRGATLPGSRNGAIIAAIVALAGALDMETTAEGIETFDQLALIRGLGVSHVQGYVYSKPIVNDDLTAQLLNGDWAIAPSGPTCDRSDRRTMYRKAGAILGCYYHPVLLRNLSESGAFIEGLVDVPLGTQIIVDFGEGQMSLATVRRSTPRGHGIQFGEPLVDDGAGGLCTSQRIAPYLLATTGMTGASNLGQTHMWDPTQTIGFEGLMQKLGLPAFGSAPRLQGAGADSDAHHKVRMLFAASNPLQSLSLLNPGTSQQRQLTNDEWERLKAAVEESSNTQLKHIIALIVLTGARFQELLNARWPDIDASTRRWSIPASAEGEAHRITLPNAAMEILAHLPKFEDCPHLIVNPRTRKPFNSVFGSWDAARKKAGLPTLSIHELRASIRKTW